MIARSCVRIAASLALALGALGGLVACGDGGLGPATAHKVAGVWAREDPTDGPTQAVDTVRIDAAGHGLWTTWIRTTGEGEPLVIFRFFVFRVRGAVIDLTPAPPCPDSAFCLPSQEIPRMRGMARNDTLTLWYAGDPPQDGPSYHQFLRASSAPLQLQ